MTSTYEVLYCLSCESRYFYYSPPRGYPSTRETCQTCVKQMSREEALASVERFPHYHFCECPAFYGYEPHPDGLYEPVAVCKKCHLPTWANRRAHLDCLGCGNKYTITSEHTDKDLCPDCI